MGQPLDTFCLINPNSPKAHEIGTIIISIVCMRKLELREDIVCLHGVSK